VSGSSVPFPSFGVNGFVAPDTDQVLAGVIADTDAAFGGNLNPALNTPQGQLASSLAAIIDDCFSQFMLLSNNVDPAYASGRFQDAIARIYFLSRNPALPTTVTVTVTGASGTIIPVGATAQDASGNIYSCTNAVTIPSGGSATTTFACNTTGPIICPVGALNSIYGSIIGWNTITNPGAGVTGELVETRAAFEVRRQTSVVLNSRTTLQSILANVLAVSGVLDALAVENDTSSAVTIGGVSVGANSMFVCVSGGASAAIAQAIFQKKSPGCGMTGNTTVVVYDTNSGYSSPYPAYNITYQTAAALTVLIAVTIANSTLVPNNALSLVQTAVLAAFNGADGGSRARIGSKIFASRFYTEIASLGSWAQIVSVYLGSINSPNATFTASISGTTMTVTATASGTIAVGQSVLGAGVADGTTIVSGSGSSFVVSTTQTVASETMYGVVPALLDFQTLNSQAPTITANDITLTLV
jgi:small basic protein